MKLPALKLPALPPALWFAVVAAACDPALVKPPVTYDAGGFYDARRAGGTGGGTPAPTAGTGGGAMAGSGGAGPPDARPAAPPPAPRPDAAPRPDRPPPPPEPDAGRGNVALLYVTGSMAPVLSDMTLVKQLQDKGFEVTTRTDMAVRAADTQGKAAVLLSGSTSAPNVMMSLPEAATLAVPIIAMDENLEPLLNLTAAANANHGTTNGTQIAILADADRELSANKRGTVTVFNAQFNISWGVPGPGALRIATVAGQANQTSMYAYPKGAMMANNAAAPDRRVFFFVRDSATANLLAADALDLFDAAVDFATGR